jgi:hypothetical protein
MAGPYEHASDAEIGVYSASQQVDLLAELADRHPHEMKLHREELQAMERKLRFMVLRLPR